MNTPRTPDSTLAVDDTRWFTEEVRPHEVALRSYLRDAFPSLEADDLVQESYFRLWKARARGRIVSSKAYIFAIARNTARTLFHRRRVYSPVQLMDLPDSAIVAERCDVAERVNEQLRFELALEAIEQLPPRCRRIFRLAVLERLSAAEIAARTSLAENTVYAQLAIGVRKCSDFLREKGERR